MAFDSVQRGQGRSLSPRIPSSKPATPKKAAAKKTPVTKAPPKPYGEVLDAVEASVSNPPPCTAGIRAEDAAWLAENGKKENIVTLPCGMQYMVLARSRDPQAKSPKLNTKCEMHFRGFLIDGTEFDSSYQHGQAFDFAPKDMIQGWTVAMQLMGEGESWEIYVPPHMAYGDAGRSSAKRGQFIPQGAALVFVLTLIKVKGPAKPKPHRSDGYVHCAVSSDEAAVGAVVAAAPLQGSAAVAPQRISRWSEEPSSVQPPTPPPPLPQPPASGGGWLGGLFERPAYDDAGKGAAADEETPPAEPSERWTASPRQRESMEQAALEAVQSMLSSLKLPTLKQALGDLGMPIDGGKAALTQRLSQRLTASAVGSALGAVQGAGEALA